MTHAHAFISTVKYEPPRRVWTEAYPDSIRVNWEIYGKMFDWLHGLNGKCEVQVLQEASQVKVS